MTCKSVCKTCGQERWITLKSGICKPCSYPVAECVKCHNIGKIYVSELCYCCYQHRQVKLALKKIIDDFKPCNKYNNYLMDLYTAYIIRYRLSYFHLKQAKTLKAILELQPVKPIQQWSQLLELSAFYKLYHCNNKKNGCAFLKIGYMLQELGVLKARRDDRNYWIQRAIEKFPGSAKNHVKSYINRMKNLGMSESTRENHLRYLQVFFNWLSITYPTIEFKSLSEAKAIEYISFLQQQTASKNLIRISVLGLRRFYSWLKYNKLIDINPFKNINPARTQNKIITCTEEHLAKLMSYISSADSPPEGAMALCLILIYGFENQDLVKAKVEFNSTMRIHLERPMRSYGKHYFNREAELILPSAPEWLTKLQDRYFKIWNSKYQKIPNTYKIPRLFLLSNKHARPACRVTMSKLICEATIQATGVYISAKILRQTCGDLLSKNGDASILSQLGWSPQFAFEYTWLPREINTGSPPPKYLLKSPK